MPIPLLERKTSIGAAIENEDISSDGSTTTFVGSGATGLSTVNDFYNDGHLRIIGGPGAGLSQKITDYLGATETITIPVGDDLDGGGSVGLISPLPAAAVLFRAGEYSPSPNVEMLERFIRDGSFSQFPKIPARRSAELSFSCELKGSGAAGTAPDISILLQACGLTETIVAATSVTYGPTSDFTLLKTISIVVYKDGLRILFMGCIGNFTIRVGLDSIPRIEFSFMAGDFRVDDSGIVAGTGYESTKPSPPIGIGFVFGGYQYEIANFSLEAGNDISLRNSIGAPGGYSTAIITNRVPRGSFDPEAVLKGTKDNWDDYEKGAERAVTLTYGRTAGNIVAINARKCQYDGLAFGERNSILTYDAPFMCNRRTATGDDEYTLTFT